MRQGIYQLPTWELIDWLKEAIGRRMAIEICAGRSCLGRPLGIPMSDSYLHLHPDMQRMYQMLKQTPTQPPDDVERLTANEAVRKYKPQVVIGAWVTQLGTEGLDQTNPCGTDEEAILDTGCIYIHIGNVGAHGKKRILNRPHLEFYTRGWSDAGSTVARTGFGSGMRGSPMTIMAELTWRGLIDQTTDDCTRLLEEPQTVYVGFDPTADSLHVGHLMAPRSCGGSKRRGIDRSRYRWCHRNDRRSKRQERGAQFAFA